MPAAWPIAKFLFKWVAPSIPEIVSTISNLKKQQEGARSQEETLEKRFNDIERNVARQLELLDDLTEQIATIQIILRRTLIISILALCLALMGLILILSA